MLQKLKYVFRDKYETYWMFRYEGIPGFEGWYFYQQRPGDLKLMAKGRISEEEVERIITAQPSKLDSDVDIDLHLWMKEVGIDNGQTEIQDIPDSTTQEATQ